jgi:methylmalonyl-CoA mutase C-terminal domain/subunit
VRAPRVVLAKPGLDGHDRGIKVVAMALRDAGAEVIYLGLRRTAEEIVATAIDEDADVIGISVLSGAHMALADALLRERERTGTKVPVVMGGTIPAVDIERLRGRGVADVFPTGTTVPDAVEGVLRHTRVAR